MYFKIWVKYLRYTLRPECSQYNCQYYKINEQVSISKQHMKTTKKF